MHLLLELDIDGTTRRISNEELSLEHSWYAELASAPEVKYASKKLYGGQVAPTYGGFTTTPETFTSTVWPAPRSIVTRCSATDTTEAEAVFLLTGTARLASFAREKHPFNLRGPAYDCSLKTNFNDTLVNLFGTYCGASYLNRTLDATMARAVSPAVSYALTTKKQLVDSLSEIAAFFTHGFYDDGTTLYLYDCLEDNGSMVLDEFDFLPATYTDGCEFSAFTAGDYSVDGAYTDGNEYPCTPVCHTNQALVEEALGNIRTIMEQQGARLQLPICAKTLAIKPGMRLSWLDESQGKPVNAWIRVQSLRYNFNQHLVTVEGRGAITA